MFNRILKRDKSAKSATTQGEKTPAYLPPEKLREFVPFSGNREVNLILALNLMEKARFGSKSQLFDIGEDDDYDYYLLEGEITLTAFDGRATQISADSDNAKNPLAYLRPRKYSARVTSKQATLLKIPHNAMETFFKQSGARDDNSYQEAIIIGQVHQESLVEKVDAAIEDGSIVLPTLPEVAIRVKAACEAPQSDSDSIAKVISQDASISAKILAAANSPLYRGAVETTTLPDAIGRLGRTTTQQLSLYYATKELFDSPIPLLRKLFLGTWHRSLERAVLAQTLAKYSNLTLNTDTAFLCGLMLRIGDLLVFQYISEVEEEPSELEKVAAIAEASSARISSRLVEDWHLPDGITQGVRCGGDWFYQAEQDPDYGELMVATNVHLRMLHNNMTGLPNLSEIPAIQRIINPNFAPETSIIMEARKNLEEYKAL